MNISRRKFLSVFIALAITPGVISAIGKPRVHTFSNLVDKKGNSITAIIYPDQEESFTHAGQLGSRAVEKLLNMIAVDMQVPVRMLTGRG